ncbi:MAG: sulfite exporter TauE/SafE family protein [Anaerolineaceae bacterium]|nr:sulfite exporter TauE/SafE family protein [Anaerolineaceae bacterium]
MQSTLYLFPLLFFTIAFIFSMLGMGGSQLYIPILYWMGMDFKTEAIPLGMLLNIVNSGTAAFTYIRKGLLDWKTAIPFGVGMLALPPVGAWLNVNLPTKPLLVFFALFTATAAILMLSGWKPKRGNLSSRNRILLGLISGSILGLIAGLIGRGGGSFVVPLLYIAGLEAQIAAATSSLIVTASGTSSFIAHILGGAEPSWPIWIASAVSVFLGSLIGSHLMATRLKSRSIKIIFGWVLLSVAALILIKDVLLAG